MRVKDSRQGRRDLGWVLRQRGGPDSGNVFPKEGARARATPPVQQSKGRGAQREQQGGHTEPREWVWGVVHRTEHAKGVRKVSGGGMGFAWAWCPEPVPSSRLAPFTLETTSCYKTRAQELRG